MATFYSSFFSSGLLAHEHAPPESSPATPRQTADPFLVDPDTTPTAFVFGSRAAVPRATTLPVVAEAIANARPTLRRRRSSLSTNASPLASIKTTAPRAARQSLLVSRTRSGSDATSRPPSSERPPLPARMRSGSLGGAAIRSARRASRTLAPPLPAPAPTAPLPPPPSALPLPSITTTQPPSTPPSRRPLARRAYTLDNVLSVPMPSPSLSPSLAPDEDMADVLSGAIPSSPGYEPAIERCGERLTRMQVDYPSPVDGGRFWCDDAPKDN
ncbi:hypothetical protein POSPLADRAFT_1037638 [Postia placenta MAD-698-R-SB12]|uniref:Uncharacterized protein n=1 Tax=Postia placenta MAD-698-R-SB12 TaxID=670580 RepID=A0A1X6MII5_9APHY|nr:hypothetical protein POSPLADRAFT_1037638 [Postia placenta MAD-698-R-SB12]OSX56148.1 hypothetical protein POSPLADRAFT_1037638 [Postia placenta MAD-698-R-SB12]